MSVRFVRQARSHAVRPTAMRKAWKKSWPVCRIDTSAFVERVSGSRLGCPRAEEPEMALHLIAFNDEWVPDLTLEELRERGTAGRALIEEMTVAGVFVFSDGGLDASTVVCSVDPSSGSPVFTDGPFGETNEPLGGFAVVAVPAG